MAIESSLDVVNSLLKAALQEGKNSCLHSPNQTVSIKIKEIEIIIHAPASTPPFLPC